MDKCVFSHALAEKLSTAPDDDESEDDVESPRVLRLRDYKHIWRAILLMQSLARRQVASKRATVRRQAARSIVAASQRKVFAQRLPPMPVVNGRGRERARG